MKKLSIPKPKSGGLLLSYKCTSECKHCMYGSSPKWNADWISERDAEKILTQLADKIQPAYDSNSIGINSGLHFTGGEPFMNFDLLVKITEIAHELKIPSTFVETNCYWCTSDEVTRDKLVKLKNAGLHGMLISVNPFILEHVPFERTERAIRISKEVFGENIGHKYKVIPYQEYFYDRFQELNLKGTLPFEEYLKLDPYFYYRVEFFPMGRAPYKLKPVCEKIFGKYPAEHFFGKNCSQELLRNWHVHIDNYGNYMTGYCGGISLGHAKNLDSILQLNLEEYPILDALLTSLENLYEIGKEFGYEESKEGYFHKCHFCTDVRKHIAQKTDEFKELRPREFYLHLE
ncbi:MAG: radical SAM protein [Candidatus Aenigmarchaeota archaeon]|nr:radical SAM protein [Candidatus Aenigmarchaeota archaeon]